MLDKIELDATINKTKSQDNEAWWLYLKTTDILCRYVFHYTLFTTYFKRQEDSECVFVYWALICLSVIQNNVSLMQIPKQLLQIEVSADDK